MNILITGVNGLVGKAIAKELINGNNIIGISRSNRNKTDLNIQYFSCNIADANFLTIFKDSEIDVIIHCAASLEMNPLSEDLISSNCMGIRNIATLAIEHNCKQFIYISSIPIIGDPIQIPITEDHPIFPKTAYHITKYFGELYLNNVLDNLELTIFRLPSPIGVDLNENKIIPSFIKKCIHNEDLVLFGKGERVQNYIDVKDIALAVSLVIRKKVKGTYNIASERSHSNRELAEICIKLLSSNSKIIYEGIDLEEKNKWIISIEKAKNDFTFKPMISIEDSLLEISKRYIL